MALADADNSFCFKVMFIAHFIDAYASVKKRLNIKAF